MKAVNIIWDADDENDLKNMPTEIDIPDGIVEEDGISDYITDLTGFCHKGFLIEYDECERLEKVVEYNGIVIEKDDLIECDMNIGVIKIDKDVFDDFAENTIIYIYCSDISENDIMEFVMKSEDEDGITMGWLDSYSL